MIRQYVDLQTSRTVWAEQTEEQYVIIEDGNVVEVAQFQQRYRPNGPFAMSAETLRNALERLPVLRCFVNEYDGVDRRAIRSYMGEAFLRTAQTVTVALINVLLAEAVRRGDLTEEAGCLKV